MGDKYPKLRLAAIQAAPVFLDKYATVDKACSLILEAGENRADIIGFPECFIAGYPHWFQFLPVHECRYYIKEMFKNALTVPGPETEKLCETVKKAGTYVVIGINEKEQNSMGTMFNTQIFISREGILMGKHRKLVPTLAERIVHKGGDGSTLNVFPTAFGKIGGLICGENTNSLARFSLLAMGELIHIASWPAFAQKGNKRNRDGIEIRTRYHAFEGKIFVISSTGIFSKEMKDMLCATEEKKNEIIDEGGFSSIIGPWGQYLAGPVTEGEQIIYADADMEEIIDGKINHDITGHYNRFDVFTLLINNSSYSPLKFLRSEQEMDKIETIRVLNGNGFNRLIADIQNLDDEAFRDELIAFINEYQRKNKETLAKGY